MKFLTIFCLVILILGVGKFTTTCAMWSVLMYAYAIAAHAQLGLQGTLNNLGGTLDQVLANAGGLTNDLYDDRRKRREADENGQEPTEAVLKHCG